MRRSAIPIICGIVLTGVIYYTHPIFFGLYRDFIGSRKESDPADLSGFTLPKAGKDILRLGTLPEAFPRIFIAPSAQRGFSAEETTAFTGALQQSVAYRASLPLEKLETFYLEVFRTQGWTLGFRTSGEGYTTLRGTKGLASVHVVLFALSQNETKVSVVYAR
ncbi:MAG: hypothetical protein Q7S09_04640 [bacterium]|nr:hypothetical protein [bacterium]